ncbi:hypothetical protein OV090_41825 [Nannocystis sp. RBIL2]|uniref:hypothetical protein n=1 Tax=Nannocystis sp. RBIL2 TaxID=2996788 RepID=UPI00226F75F2|nr:hypothetical protein [Nannocystis sp. RBIL2]MCY1071356.1 hypothetical protein [Nannocystis sp. RBIL2]
MAGCPRRGLIHEALELHGPIEAAITFPTDDPVLVRAGLFAADVVVEADDRVVEE